MIVDKIGLAKSLFWLTFLTVFGVIVTTYGVYEKEFTIIIIGRCIMGMASDSCGAAYVYLMN